MISWVRKVELPEISRAKDRVESNQNRITEIPFVIFPQKVTILQIFVRGGNDNGQKKFEKLFCKFYLILLKLYSKIHNFKTLCV